MLRPSKSEIRAQFDAFNADFFGGVLPAIPVHWRRMLSYGASIDGDERYPHGLIVLSTMAMPPCGWRGVLIHECIHAYLDLRGVDEWEHGEVAHHGPRFAAECARIGALLGLPKYEPEDVFAWPFSHHFATFESDEEE